MSKAVTNDESTWTQLSPITPAELHSFNDYTSTMGEDYVNLQTGTIGETGLFLPTLKKNIYTDGLPVDLLHCIEEVKVGLDNNVAQANNYSVAIRSLAATPGTFYFLRGPASGDIGPTGPIGRIIAAAGCDCVYFDGDWWEFFQEE